VFPFFFLVFFSQLFFFPITPSIKNLTTEIDEKYRRNREQRRQERETRRNETLRAKGKRKCENNWKRGKERKERIKKKSRRTKTPEQITISSR
jgi:hypothetical protein